MRSPAMIVKDLLVLRSDFRPVTVAATPPENATAVIDLPNNTVDIVGNFRYFTIKTKQKTYEKGYSLLKEIEKYLSPMRNIGVGNERCASFLKTGEPRDGGFEENLNGKYKILYQDYRVYKDEE